MQSTEISNDFFGIVFYDSDGLLIKMLLAEINVDKKPLKLKGSRGGEGGGGGEGGKDTTL